MRSSLDDTRVLSREEIIDRLDWAAKRRCHSSADEVLVQFSKGGLADPGLLGDVLQLLELLPDDDPILTGESNARR
ncbi:hypothetical protein ACFCZV_08765 [Streptomyces hydrogenans]|uniref:hypothetical protein n=1 Tax=Streptomyces hydrogenans TaxID=1873719 RepID=UPI0035D82EE5